MQALKIGAVVALVLAPSCASLLEPSGSGNTVTDPQTGEQREETKGDVLVTTGKTVGAIVAPETLPLLGVAGIAASALIGTLVKKKQPSA